MGAIPAYGRSGQIRQIRLMLVDDSIVARSVLKTILAPLPAFRIAATASTAEQALVELDRTAVDVVLLDLAMPGRDGLSALPEIIRRGRGARVLIVSAAASEGAEACVRAMTLGAADTLEKPAVGGYGGAFEAELIEKLHRIGPASPAADPIIAGNEPVPASEPPLPPLRPMIDAPIECIAIGSSTGGLHALSALFANWPPACRAPILITQHLPASFMPYFAAQIGRTAGRPAAVAQDGAPLVAGTITVAPGDAHLGIAASTSSVRIALDRTRAPSGCLPSVDPMFAAVGAAFGQRAFGIVLTGMGRDGVIGAETLIGAGGEIAAQDRGSAVIWGMPGAVARAGLAATVATPELIARRIGERISSTGKRYTRWR